MGYETWIMHHASFFAEATLIEIGVGKASMLGPPDVPKHVITMYNQYPRRGLLPHLPMFTPSKPRFTTFTHVYP